MEIKNKKSFNEIIKNLTLEVVKEEELDEITTTGNVDGYSTPFAFSGKKNKKRKKQISTNSTGYEMLGEGLNDKDMKKISILIKKVVGDILRDIWLKLTTWQ